MLRNFVLQGLQPVYDVPFSGPVLDVTPVEVAIAGEEIVVPAVIGPACHELQDDQVFRRRDRQPLVLSAHSAVEDEFLKIGLCDDHIDHVVGGRPFELDEIRTRGLATVLLSDNVEPVRFQPIDEGRDPVAMRFNSQIDVLGITRLFIRIDGRAANERDIQSRRVYCEGKFLKNRGGLLAVFRTG